MARVARGYMRQFTYLYDGDKQRTATGTGVNGHMGWGFPVNHGLGALGGNVDPSTAGSLQGHLRRPASRHLSVPRGERRRRRHARVALRERA